MGATIRVVVADFSPFKHAMPVRMAPGAGLLAISDSGGKPTWISVVDGLPHDPPSDGVAIATAWKSGLLGYEPPPIADVSAWKDALDPYVLRAQRVGDATLIEQARGAKEVRSFSWGTSGGLRRFRDRVDDAVRVESMGDRALVLDPASRRLEIIDPRRDDALSLDLPEPLASDVAAQTSAPAYRFLYVLPEIDRVVIAMLGSRVLLLPLDAVRALAEPGEIGWTFTPAWPRGDAAARLEGTVTIVAAGRTFVKAGSKNLTLNLTGPQKGERVTLVGKLWDANGVTQYERVELDGGRVLPLPGAPHFEREATTRLARSGSPDEPKTTSLAPLVHTLQAEGLLRHVTSEMIAAYEDGGVSSALDLLEAYYADDETRMVEDGYLTHDWRFGQETRNVIAEIVARLGGAPRFEQVAVYDDAIEVRDSAGLHHTISVSSLDDVVAFFNRALDETDDPRRLVTFQDEGDQLTYLVTTPAAAKRLAKLGLPI